MIDQVARSVLRSRLDFLATLDATLHGRLQASEELPAQPVNAGLALGRCLGLNRNLALNLFRIFQRNISEPVRNVLNQFRLQRYVIDQELMRQLFRQPQEEIGVIVVPTETVLGIEVQGSKPVPQFMLEAEQFGRFAAARWPVSAIFAKRSSRSSYSSRQRRRWLSWSEPRPRVMSTYPGSPALSGWASNAAAT